MQTLRLIFTVAAAALVLPLVATAQSVDELGDMSPQERRAYVDSLSAEEREALRTQRRAHWEAMSDEERAAARERKRTHRAEHRAAMREHWQSLSEEERAAARQQHRERVEQRRQHWDGMTDEDKAAARQRFRDHRGGMHHRKRLEKRDGGQP